MFFNQLKEGMEVNPQLVQESNTPAAEGAKNQETKK